MKFLFRLIKAIFKFIFYTAIFIFGFLMVVGIAVSLLDNENPEEVEPFVEEKSEYLVLPDEKSPDDSTRYIRHTRHWRDYAHKYYTGEYIIAEEEVEKSRAHRINIPNVYGPGTAFEKFYQRNLKMYESERNLFNWTWTYETILNHDKTMLGSMYTMFDSILAREKPDRQDFANIIVSHVQLLPYYLVHPQTCEAYYAYDSTCAEFRCQYHRDKKPCLAEVDYGVLTPVEFAYDLRGDCDTRTILLMAILDHYDYDTKLLYSYNYGHAVLGVNMPATGHFVYFQGKKYYLWETTNRDWLIGQIGASYQNMDYWDPLDIRF